MALIKCVLFGPGEYYIKDDDGVIVRCVKRNEDFEVDRAVFELNDLKYRQEYGIAWAFELTPEGQIVRKPEDDKVVNEVTNPAGDAERERNEA